MALLYRADLNPTKLELLATWLPTRSWYEDSSAPVDRVAACRFDDPAGEVGVETILVRAGDGPTFQVPLTYRSAPLDGAEAWLVGTTEHSVLGRRWVYDACGDPVYAAALARAIVTAGGEAEEFVDIDGRLEPRPTSMTLTGSGVPGAEVPAVDVIDRVTDGDPTLIAAGSVELAVVRRVDVEGAGAHPPVNLTGTWPGHDASVLLAYVPFS